MEPPAPFAPTITATKTDSFPDLDGDGKAAPGETITYDVNISNTGPDDATGVNFSDTIDGNTTLVPGSLKVSPLAFPDVFAAAENTPLVVGAPGVLTNDTGIPGPTAVPIAGGATSQGGTVTLSADGSFTYNPPADFEGNDSFTYTVTNGLTPNDTALVTLNVDAPPSVTSTTPTNGATEVAQNTDITITFSEAVNVTGNWFQIVCDESGTREVADTAVTGGPTTFTINPNSDFAATENCTVTVFAAQVSDQDVIDPPDLMAANFVFSFTTTEQELAPTVTATTPADGAVDQPTNTDITVTFSESVNVTGNWFQIVCTTSGTRNPADTAVTPPSPATTFTINPNADFAPGESCTVTIVAAQVTDADTNDPPDNMAANFVFSFTTDVAPAVTATTPTNNATGVANNTNISITFNEAVDVTGNWFQIVGATSGTKNVVDTVVTGGPTTFDINPADFTNGELVTVTVFAAQVSDQDTNDPPQNMAADFVFSFTIDQAPSVTATTPINGATGVAINSNLSITFSEAVNVTGNWFQIACANSGTRNVADTLVTGGPTTFTINPNADLGNGEVCTVTVFAAQVTDQDSGDPPDNMDANFVFSFTTVDVAPTVTATTPTNGAVNQPTTTDVTVTFSEPVNVTGEWFSIACPTSGARNVAATVVTGGPTTFTINPNADFAAAETCTVTIVAAQVTDQDSVDPPDNMAANFVFSFTMDAAPTVTATTPTNGATQQANNTDITITFSEPVDVTGNWFTIVGASSGTRNVADTVVTGGPTTFTINPNTDFTSGELVTVTVVAAQVSDQDANDPPQNMAANFVFSFTIDVPPAVTTTVPTNGAIDILKGSNIVVNFSENVNATTSSFTIECPAPGNLQPFAVSGSGTNQITLNPNSDLPPGVICTVTVIANQISDTDAGDPPDNMDANFVFSFGVKPEATDDARNATGNIRIQTAGRSNFSVLTNDIGPGITVTAFDAASLRGGQVTVDGAGTFTYNPPAGYDGLDSFNYTITNNAGSDVGTVVITITGMIWFVNTAASSCTTINGSCGRLTNPFSTLGAFETANGNAAPLVNGDVTSPEAGDHLFIHSGNYTGPLTLEANQRVIGQGATTGTTAALTGITPATDSDALPATGGAKPSIGGGGFNVVSNNHLHGLAFDDTTSTAINSNANVGTLVIGDVTILNDASNSAGIVLDDGGTSVTTVGTNSINTRSGVALSLTNATTIGAAGLTFTNISAGNNDGNADPLNGIVLNNTGANGGLTVSAGTIRNTTASGVMLTSTRAINFSNFTVQNSADDGITGLNVTNFTLTNSTITNNGNATLDRGLEMTNLLGTASITGSSITGNAEDNLYVKNGTGTLSLTTSNTTYANVSTTVGNDGIHFLGADVSGSNNANMSISVTNCTFNNHRGDHFQALTDAVSTATQSITFQNNSLTGDRGATFGGNDLGAGITLNPSGNANVSFNISNNGQSTGTPTNLPWTGAVVSAITMTSSSNATMSGTIHNNRIGDPAVTDSGSAQGNGIQITANNTSDITAAITNNLIREYSNLAGVNAIVHNGSASAMNLTITG
ncbi:MAG TPA: Ig-like domain-containing protein, partial [Pyrinomonadaceae bacterium]|nr:Ig-like domain-containing protein [Pyrinomonadaceae bacterium]